MIVSNKELGLKRFLHAGGDMTPVHGPLAIGVLLIACFGWLFGQQPAVKEQGDERESRQKADEKQVAELGHLLKKAGYSEIVLERLRSGHLTVSAAVGEKK